LEENFNIQMKKVVVLSGAGISRESGLRTFRDGDGLWKNHRFEELATPGAWERDEQLVQEFYNWRRKKLLEVEPNPAHLSLVKLEKHFDVQIITQNVDDLHERAGSKNIVHLHGELRKARSTVDETLVYNIDGWELKKGGLCEKKSQLRPHIVWFGEAVPEFENAVGIAAQADIFIVIGTSLLVYPAAGLINYVPDEKPKFLVDPKAQPLAQVSNLKIIRKNAGSGVPELVDLLIDKY
jgi:NAD-dependent protein deacetylase/lipoamidase